MTIVKKPAAFLFNKKRAAAPATAGAGRGAAEEESSGALSLESSDQGFDGLQD
jgi:hypothetical protein